MLQQCTHQLNLGRRHVLSLPPERVPDAVHEVPVALFVPLQEIARAEIQVPLLENVLEELAVSARLVAVIPD